MVALVNLLRELLHQRYHIAIVYLVRQVVQLQLQDRPRVPVLRKLSVVLPKTSLVLRFGLLVVDLDDCLLLVLHLDVVLEGGERTAALRRLHKGQILRDRTV